MEKINEKNDAISHSKTNTHRRGSLTMWFTSMNPIHHIIMELDCTCQTFYIPISINN